MPPYLDTVYDSLTQSAAQEKTNPSSPFISLCLKVLGVYMGFLYIKNREICCNHCSLIWYAVSAIQICTYHAPGNSTSTLNTHVTWCKARLYVTTDSSKSLRQAEVPSVTRRDTFHVNSNSNLDSSPDEHFRLDSCKQCEPECIPPSRRYLHDRLPIMASSPADMRDGARESERERIEGKLISLYVES